MTISDKAVEAACEAYIDAARDVWPSIPLSVQDTHRAFMCRALEAALKVMQEEGQIVTIIYTKPTDADRDWANKEAERLNLVDPKT